MLEENKKKSPLEKHVSRRKLLAVGAAGGLGAVVAAACSATPTATPVPAKPAAPKPKPTATPVPVKDTLTIVQNTLANNMDAHVGGGTQNTMVLRNIYEPPLQDTFEEGAFGFDNRLAQEVSSDADGNYVIKLREGVKFHGGEDLTSDDLKYSIERMLDPDVKSWRGSRIKHIGAVETPDPLTAKLVINNAPKPTIFPNLKYIFVLPRSWAEGQSLAFFSTNTNGTGPYKLTRFVAESVAEMEMNPDWWGGADNIGFKKIVYRFVTEAGSRAAMLQRGDADVIAGVAPDFIQVLESAGMTTVVADSKAPAYVALNNKDEENRFDPGTPNPMKDIRVRQALNYAIDRETIMKNLFRGTPFPIHSWIPEASMRGYINPDELQDFSYNPTKAKQLLKEAGYEKGFKNRIILQAEGWIKGVETAQAVADMISDVGVPTVVDPQAKPKFVQNLFGATTGPMHLEMGWPAAIDPWQLPSLAKAWFFADPEIDQAMEASYKLTIAEQDAALPNLTKTFWNKAPVIWLWQQPIIWGVNPEVNWPKFGEKNQVDMFKATPA